MGYTNTHIVKVHTLITGNLIVEMDDQVVVVNKHNMPNGEHCYKLICLVGEEVTLIDYFKAETLNEVFGLDLK